MTSLAALVEQADPDNPLLPYLRALLDSGFVVTLRDAEGRFEQTSPDFARAVSAPPRSAERAVGHRFVEGQRFFDQSGRELTRSEHPAQVARLTGVPQRQRVLGVRTAGGDETWLQMSYLPLARGQAGWSVMGIGSVLRRSYFHPPTEDLKPLGAAFKDELLAFALEVGGQRFDRQELARRLKRPVRAITSEPVSVYLTVRHGRTGYSTPVVSYDSDGPGGSIQLSMEAEMRWLRATTYYNPSLKPTDVLGDRLVVEYPDPPRSFALVPVLDHGGRVASLVASSPEPHALTPEQIEALECLGRLAGPALHWPEAAAGSKTSAGVRTDAEPSAEAARR